MARNPRSVRFPPALEEQVQEWADEHRMPFNRAVVELLGRAVAPTQTCPPKEMPEARQEPAPYSEPVAPMPSAAEAKTAFKADPKQVQQIRDLARDLAGTSGKCSADAPRGTVCKVCGKKH